MAQQQDRPCKEEATAAILVPCSRILLHLQIINLEPSHVSVQKHVICS